MVCAILPATNPTATCGGKAVGILKGRNAVIFKPSSRALKSTTEAINMMRAGLRKVGAPEDLIQVLEDPSREAITELMKVSDLIVATGSGQVVRAAYSSGTPAYGVGQGNACAIVAEDADVAEAAKMICGSKLFDYATSCSSENAVIPVEAVYDQFMAEMKKNGCYLVTGEDREKLKNHMWKPNAKGKIALNPDIIAKSAQVIADGAGISIPEGTDILLVEGMEPILGDKFHDEKISPVLTVYKAKDFKDAYRILVELTNLVGARPLLRHPYLQARVHRVPRRAHEVLPHHRAPVHERGQRRAPLQPYALHRHPRLRHLGRQQHHGKRPLAPLHQRHVGQRTRSPVDLHRRRHVGRFLEEVRQIRGYRIPVRRFSKLRKKKKTHNGFFPKTQQTQRGTPGSLKSPHPPPTGAPRQRRGPGGTMPPGRESRGPSPLAAGGILFQKELP